MRQRSFIATASAVGFGLVFASGCPLQSSDRAPAPSAAPTQVSTPQPAPHHVPIAPLQSADTPPMAQPVPLYEHGQTATQIDAATATAKGYVVLDLGEAWVPYLFTDGVNDKGRVLKNAYREVYLPLARGEFPKDFQGERARDDKYLELFGIQPTLGLLRQRFHRTQALECEQHLDLEPLQQYHGLIVHDSNEAAQRFAADFVYLRHVITKLLQKQRVQKPEELDADKLDDKDKDRLKRYLKVAPEYFAVDAAQKRLKCEGFFKGKPRHVQGAMDWSTRDALAEFERKHRVFSWGYLGKDTLEVLRKPAIEAERDAVLRVLTERAIHAASVLEDGSVGVGSDGQPRTFKGADGNVHEVPNLVADLQQRLVDAFGLQTHESALAWLDSLGKLPPNEHRFVAIRGPELPEYYDGDMELTLDYDRGDVWYDFPYDDHGREINQPVTRRPSVTVFTQYMGQKIPLARYGTTIGGWRSESVDGNVMWKYKESPAGPRVWTQIVASPVWLPPDSTPPKDLLKRRRDRQPGEPPYEINYHETGPSYASAYGLVAAYHHTYLERASGVIDVGNDEGIRTHGSVDYMSIMRRHSHGCHRLHNHIALRLMSFVLAHRPHHRVGQETIAFQKTIEYEDQKYEMELKSGGYVFQLDTPLEVEVLEGRIRGQVKHAIEFPIPKYDETAGAYVMPDGHAVQVRGDKLIDVAMPERPATSGEGALEAAAQPAGAVPVAPSAAPPAPASNDGRLHDDPKAPPNPKAKAPVFFGKPEG